MKSQAAPLPLTTPAVDTTIAATLGIAADDALAEVVTISLRNALHTHPNARHATVFAAYHGIKKDGTICSTTATFDEIGAMFGVSRQRAGELYRRAAVMIFAKLSNDLLQALKHVTR